MPPVGTPNKLHQEIYHWWVLTHKNLKDQWMEIVHRWGIYHIYEKESYFCAAKIFFWYLDFWVFNCFSRNFISSLVYLQIWHSFDNISGIMGHNLLSAQPQTNKHENVDNVSLTTSNPFTCSIVSKVTCFPLQFYVVSKQTNIIIIFM